MPRMGMGRGPLANFLELLAPTVCCACGRPVGLGNVLCDSCAAALPVLRDPRCACCGAPTHYEVDRCRECRGRQLHFERAWAPASYSGPARDLVAGLKFRGAFTVAEWMAEVIVAEAPADIWNGLLVPVPLAALRRFKRECERNGVLKEVKRREHYASPAVKRKLKAAEARRKMRRAKRRRVP